MLKICLCLLAIRCAFSEENVPVPKSNYAIEGEVIFPSEGLTSAKGHVQTRILLNHGQHIGFVKADGSFKIDGLTNGSYIVQVENVDFLFEPIRVDISTRGNLRARKLSTIQPNSVNQLPYPLKLSAREQTRYFRKREEWRVTDFIFSPTFLMLGLPMLVLLVIPKLVANDPEMQKEMESMQMPKMDMPDVSEMMANFFGGNPKQKKKAIGSGASPSQPSSSKRNGMGFFNSFAQWLGVGKKQVNICVIGLDNSGKTTVLNQLKTPDTRVSNIVPTVGLTVTNFTSPYINFNAFDMSGQSKYRNLWDSYYATSEGLMFVVDSADRLRISVARDELWMLLDHKDLVNRKIPILVLANKMDEKDAMTSAEITSSLGLDMVRGRAWHIASTCALTGAGLPAALEWLSTNIKNYLDEKAQAGN
ncbi:unnamed protein product, partial [Mesorhabditis spiculigera]